METYVVHADKEYIYVVQAVDQEQALQKFCEAMVDDDREQVKAFVNMFSTQAGLMGEFVQDEKGFLRNDEGDIRKDLSHLKESALNQYILNCVEHNAKEFWCDNPKLAEEYINTVRTELNTKEFSIPSFSKELYISVLLKFIEKGEWFNEFKITKIENISVQKIS